MQRLGGGHDVVGVDAQRVLAELGVRAGLPGEHERAPLVGDHRDLLGDEVHAVPDRVDQGHVGQPVGGQRAREVVVDVEDQRPPVRGAELLLDLGGERPHLVGVGPVLGEVGAGRVGEGDVDHPVVPLRAGAQQVPVGQEAADDVLAQLGAVDPDDGAALAHGRAQGGEPLVDVRPVGPLAQEVGVGAEAVHAEGGGAARVRHGERLAVDLRAEVPLAAVGEGECPAAGQETRPVGAEDAGEDGLGDVVGQ